VQIPERRDCRMRVTSWSGMSMTHVADFQRRSHYHRTLQWREAAS
jgi:hypothetical protein